MRLGDLQRFCRQRLRELDLPPGLTPEGLGAHLSRRRGRPLHIITSERPGDMGGVCGAWVAFDAVDVVQLDASAEGVRRQHTLLHELAHIALDHDRDGNAFDLSAVAGVLNDLDVATLRFVLGRGPFTSDQERQAEVLAWLLQREVIDTPGASADGSVDNLLSAAFDARQRSDA